MQVTVQTRDTGQGRLVGRWRGDVPVAEFDPVGEFSTGVFGFLDRQADVAGGGEESDAIVRRDPAAAQGEQIQLLDLVETPQRVAGDLLRPATGPQTSAPFG